MRCRDEKTKDGKVNHQHGGKKLFMNLISSRHHQSFYFRVGGPAGNEKKNHVPIEFFVYFF